MNDTQLYIAIGIPILFNLTALTFIHTTLNRRIDDMRDVLRAEIKAELGTILHRIERMDDNVACMLRTMKPA